MSDLRRLAAIANRELGHCWDDMAAQMEYPEAQEYVAAASPERVLALIKAAQGVIDFYNMPTPEFVKQYGEGQTTRDMCDRIRAALGQTRDEES